MRARRALAFASIAALVVIAACSPRKTLVPKTAPETTVFVQGAVDTVNSLVHLYWFGSDADGFVVAYEVRFLNGANSADTAWIRTTRLDSLFSIATPTGYAAPTFEVRAIDNDGLIDQTPAREDFKFSNQPPTVAIKSYPNLADTTYASLTLSWTGVDPDGNSNLLHYRVWLDDSTNAHEVSGTTFTIPSADFMQAGTVVGGVRTVHVQAIDSGGYAGTVASRQWNVRPTTPGGPPKLLIIDDVASNDPLNFRTDTLFVNAAARTLPAQSWSILRLETTQPFRSNADVAQTIGLYDAAIWYRGEQNNFGTNLSNLQDGIGAAIDAGHSVLIEGLNLVGGPSSSGPLRADFVARYFDTDFMFKNFQSGDVDSSLSWGAGTGAIFRTGAALPGGPDSLRIAKITAGMRGFAVHDTQEVLLWARAGTLSQTSGYDIPVGLLVPHPSGAKAGIITVPLVLTSQSSLSFPQRASAFLNKVLPLLVH